MKVCVIVDNTKKLVECDILVVFTDNLDKSIIMAYINKFIHVQVVVFSNISMLSHPRINYGNCVINSVLFSKDLIEKHICDYTIQVSLCNPCKYSFVDLIDATRAKNKPVIDKDELYSLTQQDRNIQVKIMCFNAGWYWNDVESNGVVYTSFSPFYRD